MVLCLLRLDIKVVRHVLDLPTALAPLTRLALIVLKGTIPKLVPEFFPPLIAPLVRLLYREDHDLVLLVIEVVDECVASHPSTTIPLLSHGLLQALFFLLTRFLDADPVLASVYGILGTCYSFKVATAAARKLQRLASLPQTQMVSLEVITVCTDVCMLKLAEAITSSCTGFPIAYVGIGSRPCP